MDRGVAFDLLNEPLPVVFTVAPNFLPNLLADLLDGAAIRGDGLRTLVGQRICGGLQAHWFGQAFVSIGGLKKTNCAMLREKGDDPDPDQAPVSRALSAPRR